MMGLLQTKERSRNNFRFLSSPSYHLELLLNQKILTLPRVVLRFFSIATIQSGTNLNARTGSYFVTVPKYWMRSLC